MSVSVGIGEFWKIQLDEQLNLANATAIAADVTFIASEWPWPEPNTWLNVHKIALQDYTNWALGQGVGSKVSSICLSRPKLLQQNQGPDLIAPAK